MKIPWCKPTFYGKEKEYLIDALKSTWISEGHYVDRFEREFTQRNGSEYGITTSSGTTALQLAILALGIGKGDEVIVPGFSFVAPANMVIEAGATPVYADIDPLTWCIDPKSVEKHITSKTKAIIPVHTYGNVCDMNALRAIAEKNNLYIIEDTAEATFSRYKDKYAGTFGNIGCFSFQATKTLTMGEGGFALTDNMALYQKMSLIRNHGMGGKRYWHNVIGYNFRLTNLQTAIGCAQLEGIDKVITERKRLYNLYKKHLGNKVTLQRFMPEVEAVVWAMAVRVEGDRDALMDALEEEGIETRPGFYPFSVMPLYKAPLLPVSRDVGLNIIALPFFTSLKEEEIVFICNRLKELT